MEQQLKDKSYAEYIAMVVILLMAIGTVFVFSSSANVGQDVRLARFYDFPALRQILFFPLAVLVMYAVSYVDYRRLSLSKRWFKSPVVYLLIFSVVLLVVVLIPRFGTEVNYARRWLRIPAGPIMISFQPSEMAKWAMVFFLAGFCARFGDSIRQYRRRFVPICLLIGGVVGLIIIEDFGTAVFVALLGFLILIIAGAKWWHVLTPVPFAGAAFAAAVCCSPSRMERIKAFLNPEGWADTAAYQANQSLIALGSGGLWGKGLGRGICKYGHLPEDTTDFIFAIIGEEMGFVGTTVVIVLFVIFVWLGVLVVIRCEEKFGQYLAGGIVLAVGIQALLNIGVVTVVLPTKGIPLPFVSAGGTSMLLSAAAVGVLLNIARSGEVEQLEEIEL